ncbi:hypothetical protein GCM10009092_21510 [Bowmanella denitrificans]|uniref:DUF308 domain-containing protein n=1 Tax=Bowmanella denitrificans TaxID=366582 RepID=A0ABN0X7A5_9ALTE
MRQLSMPKSLHEVFGQQQTLAEITIVLLFSLLGTCCIYYQYALSATPVSPWKLLLGLLIIADILAGFVANFSRGTNNYYAVRPTSRLVFIAIHLHLPLVAWLLQADIGAATLIWLVTILFALSVNALHRSSLQLFVAGALAGIGVLLVLLLNLPLWFTLVALFFMLKVMFSFAVDHYPHSVREQP